MRKIITLALICFTFSIPGLAFCESDARPPAWLGNVNLFLGSKFLNEDDWKPVEEHVEGGILFDIRRKTWPVSIAVDLLYSRDDKDIAVDVLGFGKVNANAESQTVEVNIGVRKIWESLKYFRPFIGGGPAIIKAELEATQFGVSISDDDTGFGVWIDAGVYVTLARHLNLGIDARWSKAKVEIFDAEGEAGGWHIGALIGFHW
jgi:hypothetical protein